MSEVVNIRQEVESLSLSLPKAVMALTCQCMYYDHSGTIETTWVAYHSNVRGEWYCTPNFPTAAEAVAALKAQFPSGCDADETILVQEVAPVV